MKKFHVKFIREFDVDVEADTLEIAQALARKITAQFPPDKCKLLSIVADDWVEPAEPAKTGPVDLAAERNTRLALNVARLSGQSADNPKYPGGIDDLIA